MPNSDDVLIQVENVSKKFCRSLKRSMLYSIEDISRVGCILCTNNLKANKNRTCFHSLTSARSHKQEQIVDVGES